ncbi:cation-translocating P-type ATPase [Haladaptatus sp. F3-133]|uniref:Cation-translocating P-type ATPase n=1 Tax=Halorutilus salinus TaxID=2487751 RepID=A0A9Q4C373_9EURY|nr:cation-translocating P-type ATPase [Halorutilus salinus]
MDEKLDESRGDGNDDVEDTSGDGLEQTFLRVDGMHSSISEDLLEKVGEGIDGVEDVSASYVTGGVKLRHDGSVSGEEVKERLSTAGHTAYTREEGGEDDDRRDSGSTVTGAESRRDEPMIGVKHAVGIIFGGFLLIPYMALVYPGYVLSFLNVETGYSLSAADGATFLRLYMVLTGFVLYFTGLPVLRGAYMGILTRKPNTDMLVSLTIVTAYLYGTVAAFAGRGDVYYDLTIVVSSVVVSSIFYESSVKEKAVEALGEITSSRIDEARLYTDDGTEEVNVDEVAPDDRILVREGERVPVGGSLVSGSCTADESVVTGESLPVDKKEGDEMVAGSTVTSGVAVVRVAEDGSTGVRGITRGVWDIQAADHGAERRTNRIASFVLPVLVVVGVAVGAVYLARGASSAGAVLAALTVFLTASPWGMGLVAPLTSASNITEATENGIVVFDETHFERLRGIDTVVFDKTGTLTTGEMEVVGTEGSDELLRKAGSLEGFASHPAAEAVHDAFGTDTYEVEEVETFATGVSGKVGTQRLLVGNRALFDDEGWDVSEQFRERAEEEKDAGRLPVMIGADGEAQALITLSDEHRESWRETVSGLTAKGIEVVILTGDGEEATRTFAEYEDVDTSFSEVPPKGKMEAVRRLSDDGTVAMVGDGTNDALPLAEADFSISMDGGTAVAADAADFAVVEGDIRLVDKAFEISQTSRRKYRQNLSLSFLYNLMVVPSAVLGILNPLLVISAASVTAVGIWVNSSWLRNGLGGGSV